LAFGQVANIEIVHMADALEAWFLLYSSKQPLRCQFLQTTRPTEGGRLKGKGDMSRPTTTIVAKRPTGMAGFSLVWLGQIVSVLASNMTSFALTIWMFQETRSAMAMGLMQVCFIAPFLLISPFAGAMVDRYNRKLMMMVSDLVAVTATVAILILQATGLLQFWHLYVAVFVEGLGSCFQWPAYLAAISVMVPKEQYGRANGMMSLIDSGPGVFSPILAGALLPFIGLTGILFIDVATFFLAIGALLVVAIPQPEATAEGKASKGSLVQEAAYGFKYIFARRPLLALLLTILLLNLVQGLSGGALVAPMILARTGDSSVALGSVESAWAIGGVLGGLLMSAWGGPKRRIRGMLLGWMVFTVFGQVLFGLGRNVALWIPAVAIGAMSFPVSQGCSNAIWQAKVAPDVQGRVFSARRFIAWFVDPISPILAGVLADGVTEPAMQSQTWLSETFGRLVGTGPGSGMALQFILSGVIWIVIIAAASLIPVVRNVEDLLPDHEQSPQVAEAPAELADSAVLA
jgi:DHA3 family macrolide efflux protein-like MFS transporter